MMYEADLLGHLHENVISQKRETFYKFWLLGYLKRNVLNPGFEVQVFENHAIFVLV